VYRLFSAVFESPGSVLHPNCVQFLSTGRELPRARPGSSSGGRYPAPRPPATAGRGEGSGV